jgi:Leucine-rich repeat (LRR) protein
MKWLECLLEKWNKTGPAGRTKVRPVWFYPWKYDNKEDVRRGLIASVILNAIDPQKATWKTTRTAFKLAAKFVGKTALDLYSSKKISIGGFEVDAKGIKRIIKNYREAAHPELPYLHPFESVLERWVRDSLGKNQRMVIFIDDLDRCMPDIALQVLEALKLYLNIPGLIFILGVDKEVVGQLVVEHYRKLGLVEKKEKDELSDDKERRLRAEEKAKLYLSKMFQIELVLEPTEQQISDFFNTQLKDITYWKEPYLSPDEQELFRNLVLKFGGRNPREVKRLLNSALMTGAGSVLIGKDGMKFNQGLQLFFVRKILDERYTMGSEAGSKRGIEFFVQWSQIIREGREQEADFPLTVKVPSEFGKEPQKELEIEEKTRRRLDNVFVPFAREEYHELLKNQQFFGLLKLLADEELGRLMQIAYPPEVTEVTMLIGTSGDADIIREALARHLEKKTDELSNDDYRKTTELNLSGSGITDISALKHFPDLQELFLRGTQVSDLSPLERLAELKMLSISRTSVTDIQPLKELKKLQTLYLHHTTVSDLGPLTGITTLEALDLGSTQISDIDILSGLTNLQKLSLADTKVNDIGALAGLTNLQELVLSDTQIGDIRVLSGLTNLRILYLSRTQIGNVNVLSGLTSLQFLNLSGTRVSDIGALSGLTNLQELYLRDTQVSDVGCLASLTKLQRLGLSRTKVNDIGGLSRLTRLQWLDLTYTSVSDEQLNELKKALPDLVIGNA